MKKLMITAGVAAMLILGSCKDKKEETPPTPPPVEDPAPPPAPSPTTSAPVEEDPDGTSISINRDGVNYEKKNGDNQSKVNVSEDGSAVEIKTEN